MTRRSNCSAESRGQDNRVPKQSYLPCPDGRGVIGPAPNPEGARIIEYWLDAVALPAQPSFPEARLQAGLFGKQDVSAAAPRSTPWDVAAELRVELDGSATFGACTEEQTPQLLENMM